MKVFEFDPVTGKRGAQIADIARPTMTANPAGRQCVLPPARRDADWFVATVVECKGEKLHWPYPVCFCLGKFHAGIDESWHWIAYLPE